MLKVTRIGLCSQYRNIPIGVFKCNSAQHSIFPTSTNNHQEMKFLSVSASLNGKTRKQVKNKNLKKDPKFFNYMKIGSYTDKYLQKNVKKSRDLDLWIGITLEQLSQQLELDVDDVMEVILSFEHCFIY